MNNFVVSDLDDIFRIDKYLIDKLNISRNKIQELISNNLITVNNEVVKNNYKVKENDIICVLGDLEVKEEILPENIDVDIIYEDDDVMVINKPSGMVVHPATGNISGTLVNALLYLRRPLSNINGELRPGIIHRLDKDTSGLMIIAKNNESHKFLSKEIKERRVKRNYIALVRGVIAHETGTIDAPIGRDPKDRKKMCVIENNSKEAITYFRVIEKYNEATLVECMLETGRTHQIRVHFKYIKHPIINDPVYNKKKNTDFGQMLHSKTLSFIHPTTKKELSFTKEAPEEFYSILELYKK